MVTLFQATIGDEKTSGYTTKKEIDTNIPPKARPIFNAISVNGVAIDESEILHEAQNHPADNPGQALSKAARALIVRELLWQEAKRLNFDTNLGQRDDESAQIDSNLAIDRLIDHEVKTPQATDEECRRIYNTKPDKFCANTIFEVRHILLAAPTQDEAHFDSAKQTARQLINALAQHPDRFEKLAHEFSACASKSNGGLLGPITRGQTVKEFEDALMKQADIGLISAPVETRYGLHIVEILHKTPGERLPYEAVKARIGAWLEAASWSKAVSQYIKILATKADIKGINVLDLDGPLVQ